MSDFETHPVGTADRLVYLEMKVKLLEKVEVYLRTSYPENNGHYFICGEGGSKDDNDLPERLHICPSYGCDWMQIYERTDRVTGPEW